MPPMLTRDYAVILYAQKARGYEIERVDGGLFTQSQRIAPIVIPMRIGSIIRGEDMVMALDLLCFRLRHRTWIQQITNHWHDYVNIPFETLLLVALIILQNIFHISGF
jgi:energy-coupling factor transport system permease protein